jgi:hypothetical protein
MARRAYSAEEIMERGGFIASETGPYVTALREETRKQVANGLLERSPGTWGPDAVKVGAEGRAAGVPPYPATRSTPLTVREIICCTPLRAD